MTPLPTCSITLSAAVTRFVLIHRFKVLPDDGAVWYDVGAEVEREGRDEHARYHVGSHESFKRDASCQHGNNL